jgi:long-chain acyl-CoA synthetase
MLAQLTLAAGGSLVLMPSFEPQAALALIDESAVAATYLTRDMVQAMTGLPAADLERFDTSSLDAAIVGDALDPEPAIDLFGEDCLHTLAGDSRSGPLALLEPAGQRERPGSLGRPLAGVRLTPAGEGELALDSPLAADGVRSVRGRLDDAGHLWPA